MAKPERSFNGNFDTILNRVVNGVMNGSASASPEDKWDVREGNGLVRLCAITSGGSQALFFTVNTWGEETFLDTLQDVL